MDNKKFRYVKHKRKTTHFKRDLIDEGIVEELLQLAHRDLQVALIELVRNVPPEGAELSTLLDHRVEERQAW